ncbi:hypothetical protein [Kribbella monticola]|uniref:hypothetical protein n=1 Tax=Kribbella monticola TaxID=2185285 RepID=UPI000DD4A873|nr:hypothetical protein [Kribbella monticola]
MSEERLTELLDRVTPEPPPSIELTRMARRIVDDSELRTTFRPRRRFVPALIAAAAVVAIAAATVSFVAHRADQPAPAGGGPTPTGQEVERAKETLTRWDKALGDSAYLPIQPSSTTRSNPAAWQFQQVGDWPGMTGRPTPDSAALDLRMIAEQRPLPTNRPPAGRVVWANGNSASVPLLSQAETLQQLRAGADICVGCKPGELDGVKASTLVISKVTPTTMQVQTTRGPATVPAYRFSFVGKSVQALQAAVAPPTVAPLPSSGQFDPPIASGRLGADQQTLTVHFTGTQMPASEPCGEDYSAFAVESDKAVAVIVTSKPHAKGELCNGSGADRTAVVHLKTPLAGRPVLEIAHGTAIQLTS